MDTFCVKPFCVKHNLKSVLRPSAGTLQNGFAINLGFPSDWFFNDLVHVHIRKVQELKNVYLTYGLPSLGQTIIPEMHGACRTSRLNFRKEDKLLISGMD